MSNQNASSGILFLSNSDNTLNILKKTYSISSYSLYPHLH